jgi:hypothetical protein
MIGYYARLFAKLPGLVIDGTGRVSAGALFAGYILQALARDQLAQNVTSLSAWWLAPIGAWVLLGLLRANYGEVVMARDRGPASVALTTGGDVSQSGNVYNLGPGATLNVYNTSTPPPPGKTSS